MKAITQSRWNRVIVFRSETATKENRIVPVRGRGSRAEGVITAQNRLHSVLFERSHCSTGHNSASPAATPSFSPLTKLASGRGFYGQLFLPAPAFREPRETGERRAAGESVTRGERPTRAGRSLPATFSEREQSDSVNTGPFRGETGILV